MSVYEHAMVGINGALAVGLHRRHGWQIVALAGFAAILPDCDGLTLLLGPSLYAEAHRVWMHNLLVAGLAASIVAVLAYRWDAPGVVQRWLTQHWPALPLGTASENAAACACQVERLAHRRHDLWLWLAVGVAAAYSHLLLDVTFSAGANFPIWGVPLFWPFSDHAWAYPLVPWGDVGVTLIFAAAMFAMLRWPAQTRLLATASLAAAAAYMLARGTCG